MDKIFILSLWGLILIHLLLIPTAKCFFKEQCAAENMMHSHSITGVLLVQGNLLEYVSLRIKSTRP